MVYISAADTTYLWVARPDDAVMLSLPLGANALEEAILDLREGLDPTGMETIDDIPLYDTELAHELFLKLFAPARPWLKAYAISLWCLTVRYKACRRAFW